MKYIKMPNYPRFLISDTHKMYELMDDGTLRDVEIRHSTAYYLPGYRINNGLKWRIVTPRWIEKFTVGKEFLSLEEIMRKEGYIIGSVTDGVFSVAARPVVHTELSDAKAEAERLAKFNPGKEFIVLKDMGRVQNAGVVWR